MDNTLRAILSELMSVSLELDRLRQRVAELEAELAKSPAFDKRDPPTVRRLVKEG